MALERSERSAPAALLRERAAAGRTDLFFQPLKLPAIAGHGAELRLADGTVHARHNIASTRASMPRSPAADDKPGVVVEDKARSPYTTVRRRISAMRCANEVNAICARVSLRWSKFCPANR